MKKRLAENWKRIEQRVAAACASAGRDPSGVTVVAVTKYAGDDAIRILVELGVRDLGESRTQELSRRADTVREWIGRRALEGGADAPAPRWHMVGHLQRNKVKAILPGVHLIHSLDSLRLAEEIDAQSKKLGVVTSVLMEVNAGGEATKSGVAVAATTHLAEQLQTLTNLELRGLMSLAPLTDDRARIHGCFRRVRELFDEIIGERIGGPAFRELSLGMSHDFEIGIELGATIVRIGSALFEGVETAPRPVSAE